MRRRQAVRTRKKLSDFTNCLQSQSLESVGSKPGAPRPPDQPGMAGTHDANYQASRRYVAAARRAPFAVRRSPRTSNCLRVFQTLANVDGAVFGADKAPPGAAVVVGGPRPPAVGGMAGTNDANYQVRRRAIVTARSIRDNFRRSPLLVATIKQFLAPTKRAAAVVALLLAVRVRLRPAEWPEQTTPTIRRAIGARISLPSPIFQFADACRCRRRQSSSFWR